jgi:hypothetical protein
MTRTNDDIEQLIWNPVAAYDLRVPTRDIHDFQEQLWNWESRHTNSLPHLDTVTGTDGPLASDW